MLSRGPLDTVLCFYGTDSRSAAIRHLKEGFPEGTSFSRHLEVALTQGPMVFSVILPQKYDEGFDRRPADERSIFIVDDAVPAAHILDLVTYSRSALYTNQALGEELQRRFQEWKKRYDDRMERRSLNPTTRGAKSE